MFLVSAASAGALSACGGPGGGGAVPGGPTPTPSASPTAPPPAPSGSLVFDLTQTDLPAGTPVYAYVIGQIGSTGAYYWFNVAAKTPGFQQMSGNDNVYSATNYPQSMSGVTGYQSQLALGYQNSWADYSIPLTVGQRTTIALGAAVKNIPGLGTGTAALGGRIFLSAGPLKLPITGDPTAPTLPALLQGPGMYCLFDWMEYSVDNAGTLYLNTTQVDQFGFQLIGSVGNAAVSPNPIGPLSGTREGLMAQMAATMTSAFGANQMTLSGGYSTSVYAMAVPASSGSNPLYPKGVNYLRALAPKSFCTAISGYTPSAAVTSHFDAYVAQCYAYWNGNVVTTTDTADGVYSAFVPAAGPNAGSLVFYSGNLSLATLQGMYPGTAPAVTLAPPSTGDIWQCANSLASGSSVAKDIQKIVAAAFNRGTVSSAMNDTATSVPGAYSGANPLPGSTPVWNSWAQGWHQYNTDAFAYGFPYDDVNAQAAVFHEASWSASDTATIVLGTFSASHLTSGRRSRLSRSQLLTRVF